MTYSALATRIAPTKKYGSRDGKTPKMLVLHHTGGGTDESNIDYLANSGARASVTYINGVNSGLVGSVDEDYRPWTTGVSAVDAEAITVENVNTTHDPTWEISDRQLNMLARLADDCARRYGWGKLTRQNVRGHREFRNTLCPGPYIWGKMDAIIAEANRIAGNTQSNPTPTPPNKVVAPSGNPLIRLTVPYTTSSRAGQLQSAINYVVRDNRLKVDNVYGPATYKEVVNLQKFSGLVPDGVYGPLTQSKLNVWISLR